MKSESIAKLAPALVKAQSEFKAVQMNSMNPFYKSKYADLGAVIESCKPVLKVNGLAISQLVEGATGEVGVTTMLIHESGEFLSSTVTIPVAGKDIGQEAGKAVTYLRRYALASILGLYADEDTDSATKPEKETKQTQDLAWALKYKTPSGHELGPKSLDELIKMRDWYKENKQQMKSELQKAFDMVMTEKEKN
jgi:hypothetical protein